MLLGAASLIIPKMLHKPNGEATEIQSEGADGAGALRRGWGGVLIGEVDKGEDV